MWNDRWVGRRLGTVWLAVKLMLFLALLPAIAIWLLVKLAVHRWVFVKSMEKAGMPAQAAKLLVKDISAWKLFV
ncbi:MAG: hypothetical protein ACOX8S_04140 [Christensenellales bacterium]